MKHGRGVARGGASLLRSAAAVVLVAVAVPACQTPPTAADPAPPESEAAREDRGEALRTMGFVKGEDGWILGVGSPILFEINRDEIRPETRAAIAEIAHSLKRLGVTMVRVEGHTDSIGERRYNLDLSRRRAEAVARELARNGLPASAIERRGRGPDYPAAENVSSEGRARNRRVDIIVVNL